MDKNNPPATIGGRVLYTRIPGIPRDGAFFATFLAGDGMEFHTETGNRISCPSCIPSNVTRQYGVVLESVEDW